MKSDICVHKDQQLTMGSPGDWGGGLTNTASFSPSLPLPCVSWTGFKCPWPLCSLEMWRTSADGLSPVPARCGTPADGLSPVPARCASSAHPSGCPLSPDLQDTCASFFFFEGVHCLLLSVLFYNFLLFSGMNGVRNIKVKISTSYLICCCNNPKSRIEFTVKKYNLFD
jgi:hypothetical protein